MTPCDQICESLRAEPEKWKHAADGYTLRHENGVELWVANGFFFYQIYLPSKRKFNFIEKCRIAAAIGAVMRAPLPQFESPAQ